MVQEDLEVDYWWWKSANDILGFSSKDLWLYYVTVYFMFVEEYLVGTSMDSICFLLGAGG